MCTEEVIRKLNDKGLKITPQRIVILEAILNLNNHPTADQIIEYIRRNHPNISVATVYKVLEVLTMNDLVNKVKTEKDIMRYDAIMESHHHIYCSDSERIEDYEDHELNELLKGYFSKKKIPGFDIEDLKLQIIGKFKKNRNRE